MNNPRLTIEQIAIIKNKTVENLIKTYWGKPHLEALPYDRRSTKWSELRERYDACQKEMDKLKKEMNSLRDISRNDLSDFKKNWRELDEAKAKLEQWEKDNQAFFDADDKVLEEKKEWMSSIMDRANLDVSLSDDLYKELYGLSQYYFTDKYPTSFLTKEEQNEFNELAGKIVDFAYEQTGGDDTAWSNKVIGIADDLRVLARNDYFDKDLPQLEENAHSVGEVNGLQDHINILQKEHDTRKEALSQNHKQLKKDEKIFHDYFNEQINIANRCDKLGLI